MPSKYDDTDSIDSNTSTSIKRHIFMAEFRTKGKNRTLSAKLYEED